MPKSNKDIQKVQSLIARSVTEIVSNNIKNEKVGFMTVTRVEVSSDHSYCKIFVSFLNNAKNSMEILNRAKGFVRSELAHQLSLRRVPEIAFELDDTFYKQERLEKLLNKEAEDIEKIKKWSE